MERGRPARKGQGTLDTDNFGEFSFECIDMRPERSDPIGIEGVQQERTLPGTHMWR